ncbi:NHLP bacteriocin export ABC transporter permease/ATPase subunit [Acetobacterium woodii]|uniref:ABC transport system ATP-binding protein n=1 Tax=Acetobacterium woodii (strain ATCC 29683 / DSM 1030 / JCM 2381 / KCTC 1655 / WB1) TaxID=931626 RepID=H6LBP0_ACEWD|nr:NHLP bacteriocin export ABC transporter permease/ATPase subunit [Acetobacterium woodii]AFA50163.1 ABC transport system ATP-binding protein [Acetobacterium woodii DSM 1030]
MSWFDEQIKERLKSDNDSFSEAFANISSVIMGKSILNSFAAADKRESNAISEILAFYYIKMEETNEKFPDLNEKLEYYMRPHGLMRRSIKLDDGWYKDCVGALLGETKEGNIVALIPGKISGYTFFNHETGKRVKVTRKNAAELSDEAICFYKPFPLKALKIADLLIYTLQTLSVSDFVMVGLAMIATMLIGMLLPYINKLIFSVVVPSGITQLIIPIALFYAGVTISQMLLGISSSLIQSRVNTKINISVQSAAMMRVLVMPVTFFKDYSAGELASRVGYVNSICNMLQNTILSVGLPSLFSLVYITQIFAYSPGLVMPALLVTLCSCVVTLVTALLSMKRSQKTMSLSSKQNGMQYSLITGIQKIRLTGAEKRAFVRWSKIYSEIARLSYNPPVFLKYSGVLSTLISAVGTLAIYYYAVKTNVGVAGYMAFNISYGMVSGAFASLFGIVNTIAGIKPTLEMALPLLKSVPEAAAGKKIVTKVSGNIEFSNVSFRYNENMPLILDNLSIKIRAGQYIAIVGQTGCGKSTLMRLLLGFETPAKGAVYYDGKDLSTVDLKSIRRNIGVVMQNGKLMQGDIYSNIVVAAPWLTLSDAWEAAELAGIAADIRAMPMGMHTVISEGSGGISGGQKQRLMIARAVAPKPKIIMFDEATSALDNITQKHVSESLDRLKCTRIVVAHRLSTIKQCDRIIVLDKGKIIEDGSYETLVERNGYFAELIARQRLDETGFIEATTAY